MACANHAIKPSVRTTLNFYNMVLHLVSRYYILCRQVKQLGSLKPEQKVALAIEMSDACMNICAAGIMAQNPNLSDEDLLEELRKRVEWVKRRREGNRRLRIV